MKEVSVMMNLELIKAVSKFNINGYDEEINLEFYSEKELETYKLNPYVKSVRIVEHYTNLTLEEFNMLRR